MTELIACAIILFVNIGLRLKLKWQYQRKNYQNLESVSLGDTVTAKIPKLNLDLETRVVKTVYDLILDRIITIECGTVTPNIVTNQFQSNQELSNKLILSLSNLIKSIIFSLFI